MEVFGGQPLALPGSSKYTILHLIDRQHFFMTFHSLWLDIPFVSVLSIILIISELITMPASTDLKKLKEFELPIYWFVLLARKFVFGFSFVTIMSTYLLTWLRTS